LAATGRPAGGVLTPARRGFALFIDSRGGARAATDSRNAFERTAKDGLPLFPAAENSFSVVIELDAREEPLEEKPFVLKHADGSRAVWKGGNTFEPAD
jgi:hypothetical protein